MNAFILLLPFFVIRLGLMSILSKKALLRAAHFAPMYGRERTAYYIYQLSNAAVFIYPLFLKVRTGTLFVPGALVYTLGLCILTVSVVNFSFPDDDGLNMKGVYRFSRNPMYAAYFLIFSGMALMTGSGVLFGITAAFQFSAHWIILAEERWCLERFGEKYEQYMKRVRRYF